MKEVELYITVAICILVGATAFLVPLNCYIYLKQIYCVFSSKCLIVVEYYGSFSFGFIFIQCDLAGS